MERLLVYQHVLHEHIGRFADIAQDKGIEVDVVRFWENYKMPNLEKYSRLLIMGGPQSIYDSLTQYPSKTIEIESIKLFTQLQKPVLGICLGSQIIAYALGGSVYPNKVKGKSFKETGFYTVQLTEQGKTNPLFQGFPEFFEVFHWHGDVFDLPEGAILLVTAQKVHNQAFAYGSATCGVLFHLEVTPQMIEELITVDNKWLHKDNAVDEGLVVEQAYKNERNLKRLSERLFENWLNLQMASKH